MSTFQHRLTRTVEAYRGLQAADGGWGEDPWVGSPTSIVNTVEVLAVMRAAGTTYDDEAVQRALRYLSEAVVSHPQPVPDPVLGSELDTEEHAHGEISKNEARGENTRYCAWGISGLTLFKASRHDPALREAQSHCVSWLAEHECGVGGAWGEGPEDLHPSLVSTSAAITGLSRVCPYSPAGPEAGRLVERARTVVRQLAHRTDGARPKAFWSLRADAADARGSASATAMAVIALSGGAVIDRELAFKGAQWLLANPAKWESKREVDGSVPEADWRHMTFSLALRAILRGTHQPRSKVLRRAVLYLDSLWHESKRQWSHGVPGADPSPSGAYAVVAAYEAMANAWPFDVNREMLGEKAVPDEARASPEALLRIGRNAATLVSDLDGSEITANLTPVQAQMMILLGKRRIEGAGIDELDAKSWDVLELAEEIESGVDAATVERYVRKINENFKDVASSKRKDIGIVVQVQKSSTSLAGRRALVTVKNVTVVD
jgi:hypothetical protein